MQQLQDGEVSRSVIGFRDKSNKILKNGFIERLFLFMRDKPDSRMEVNVPPQENIVSSLNSLTAEGSFKESLLISSWSSFFNLMSSSQRKVVEL